jgi:ferredoxin
MLRAVGECDAAVSPAWQSQGPAAARAGDGAGAVWLRLADAVPSPLPAPAVLRRGRGERLMSTPASPPAAARLPQIGSRCTGCGRCVAACAVRVLWLERMGFDKRAVLHRPSGCTGCAQCAVVCPVHAVRMRRAPAANR